MLLKMLVLFAHLLGTCLALGMIALTDARLIAKVLGYRVVIPPPSRFETRAIALALLMLVVSGAALVAFGLAENRDYLGNPKLQAKMLLVALLCANAFVLHYVVFPSLERATPVSQWSSGQLSRVSLSVGLSNGLWLYCAFLGIARPWNFSKPITEVLLIAMGVWLALAVVVRFALVLAARNPPEGAPDWLDSVKATLSGLGDLGGYAPRFDDDTPGGTDEAPAASPWLAGRARSRDRKAHRGLRA